MSVCSSPYEQLNFDFAAMQRAELLAAHFEQTGPHSRQDFIGKEHLWALGLQTNTPQPDLSCLWGEVCFPVILGQWRDGRAYGNEVIAPETLGLDIKTRVEAGVSASPIPLGTDVSNRMRKHGIELGKGNSIAGLVIRVSGLVYFASAHEKTLGLYLHPQPLSALKRILPTLVELPD